MDKQIYFWGKQKYFLYLFVGNEMTNETLFAFFLVNKKSDFLVDFSAKNQFSDCMETILTKKNWKKKNR